jgi:hypothetical protein
MLKREENGNSGHLLLVMIAMVFSGLLPGGELNFPHAKSLIVYPALLLTTTSWYPSELRKEICYEFDPTTLPRIRIFPGSQIICLQV